MKPVSRIEGRMVPLDRADVDTDQIIPQQFLKRIERDGYGDFLFYNWAHTDDGSRSSDFVINDPARSGAKVLVAGPNFGCGSSREHAAWAIQQWGFEAVIAPSFADIFRNNAVNIGLVPVELDEEHVNNLLDLARSPSESVTVDLEAKTVLADGLEAEFRIADEARQRLLIGLDRIGETLQLESRLASFESRRPGWLPSSTA